MKALVCNKNRELFLQDVLIPEPERDQIRIAVKFAGICKSDLHILDNSIKLNVKLPVILGHEFSGIIDKVGKNVYDFRVGDEVSSETAFRVCDHCEYCLSGNYNRCQGKELIGYVHNGAFAEYIVVPAKRVHKLDAFGIKSPDGDNHHIDKIDLMSAAMLEPTACVTHAVFERADFTPDNTIVIAGPGTIGLLAMQALKNYDRVIIYGNSDTDEWRYNIAEKLSPKAIVVRNDAVEIIMGITRGYGANVFIECSGSPYAVNDGFRLLARGGTFIQIGLMAKPDMVDFAQIAYKELHVVGSIGSRQSSWEKAKLILGSKWIKTESMITMFSLDDYKDAFESARVGKSIKAIFKM